MTETSGFSADDVIALDQGLFLSIGINARSNHGRHLYIIYLSSYFYLDRSPVLASVRDRASKQQIPSYALLYFTVLEFSYG